MQDVYPSCPSLVSQDLQSLTLDILWHLVVNTKGKGPGKGKGHWHFHQAPGTQAHLNTAVQGTEVFQEFLGGILQVGVAALGHGQDALQG